MSITSDDIAYVRHLIADPAGSTQMFTDDTIEQLCLRNSSYIKAAAAEGWSMKAANYASLVDITESGSTRLMSQKFRQAIAMANHYIEQVEKHGGLDVLPGVVGRVAKILCDSDTFLISDYVGPEQITSIRCYPTKRMLAVLG